ncbi:kinase-like domain-containing protein [Tuber brumale]|nr:kinase-like domain-containing protein [Tuber brumale]
MQYLQEGDLSKNMGRPLPEAVQNISKQILEGLNVMHEQGIAHRDLKPANIFIVSMPPVWVKLGDFGISKRILAQDATTFYPQVSTQVYGAREVLGLYSINETSEYTNSVDIWSLRCVHMLVTQPKDRPTAASALKDAWLAGLKGDNEDCADDQEETTHGRDERTRSDKNENKTASHKKRSKSRSERNPITQGSTKYTRGDVISTEGLRSRGVTVESTVETAPPRLELTPRNFQAIRSMEMRLVANGKWLRDARPPASYPSSPDLPSRNSLKSTPGTNDPMEHNLKRKSPAPIHDKATARIAHWRAYPAWRSRSRSDDSDTSVEEVLQSTPNTPESPNAGWNTKRNPNMGQNPYAGWNPKRNPNAS